MQQIRSLGGRYPYALARYDPREIRVDIAVRAGDLVVRIDDVLNPDRWEEIAIPFESVLSHCLEGHGDVAVAFPSERNQS